MLQSSFAALVASLVVVAGRPEGDIRPPSEALVLAAPPLLAPQQAAMAALPPPPDKVRLETAYYGTVTVDHKAHLARRAACSRCHGPGPVHKLGRLAPADAHDRCRGCHQEANAGPTECRGCHVVAPPTAAQVAFSAPAKPEPAALPPPPATPPDPASGAHPAALAVAAPRVDAFPDPIAPEHRAYRRTVHVGTAVAAGSARTVGPGFAVRLTMRQDGWLFSESVEWAGRGTVGLTGAGAALPLARRCTLQLVGLGGFDVPAGGSALVLPALGGRAGIEWTGVGRRGLSIDLSLTGVHDLLRGTDADGGRVGGLTLSFAASVGFDLSSP